MNYYLAFVRTYGKEDGYYQLVKAYLIEEARSKVKKKVSNSNKLIDISEAID